MIEVIVRVHVGLAHHRPRSARNCPPMNHHLGRQSLVEMRIHDRQRHLLPIARRRD